MKIIVYSCNIKNYDRRKTIADKDSNTQYLYYTDNMEMLDGWQLFPADMTLHDDHRKVCRYYKINSHLLPKHDYSIWVDASFRIQPIDILKYIKQSLRQYDIASYYHAEDDPKRSCIYQEMAACMGKLPDDAMIMLEQVNRYKTEGFPERFGLRSTGIIIRRNNEIVKRFNETWWDEVSKGSHRDQLSQMYTSWKTGIDVGKITEGTVYINEFARFEHHNHRLEEMKLKRIRKRRVR